MPEIQTVSCCGPQLGFNGSALNAKTHPYLYPINPDCYRAMLAQRPVVITGGTLTVLGVVSAVLASTNEGSAAIGFLSCASLLLFVGPLALGAYTGAKIASCLSTDETDPLIPD